MMPQIMQAHLFAYLCVLAIALGSLSLIMLHNLTGGAWGVAIRPTLHAAALTLPLLAVLFVPIALTMPALFPWAADRAADEVNVHRAPYLNVPFFLVRAVAYFGLWIALAFAVAGSRDGARPHRGLNAAGLIIYLFTMTHASVDWIMSRESAFYSTAFGLVVTLGQNLVALAFAILLVPQKTPCIPPENRLSLFNDIGNVLLTLVILWTYVSFMQFLVVWMGNSHEDNAWYATRGLAGGGDVTGLAWRLVGAGLILFHFFVPFYLLLFRSVKQRQSFLAGIAALLLAAHFLDISWLTAPNSIWWMELIALAVVGAIWFALFMMIRKRRPAVWTPPPPEEVSAHA